MKAKSNKNVNQNKKYKWGGRNFSEIKTTTHGFCLSLFLYHSYAERTLQQIFIASCA